MDPAKITQILIEEWSSILKIPAAEITPSSNWFELGGHSRLGIELIVKLRKTFDNKGLLTYTALFSYPTIAQLTMAILATSSGVKSGKSGSSTSIPSTAPFPLTFAQEQIWIHNQSNDSEKVSTEWNVIRVLKFHDGIEKEVLETALNQILARHDSLRIRISETAVTAPAQQMIGPHDKIQLDQLDSSHGDLLEVTRALRAEPYDLNQGPLFKFYMYTEDVLIVCYHHMLMDGHGWTSFIEELDSLYEHHMTGLNEGLEELEVSFQDVVIHERGYNHEESLLYWKNNLKNLIPFNIPANPPTTAVVRSPSPAYSYTSTTANGEQNLLFDLQFPPELTLKLNWLARAEKTTLFTLMLGAFKVLAYRYTRQADQTIITLFRGDLMGGSENVIGHFVNLIPIRTRIGLNGESTFREYLDQIKSSLILGIEHASVPFQQMGIESTNIKDLLRIMFQMRLQSELVNFEEEWLVERGASVIDLGIDIELKDDGILVSAEYNPRVFTLSFIKRFLQHYEELCRSITTSPDQIINSLNILPSPEHKRIIDVFTTHQVCNWGCDSSLIESFQKSAQENPTRLCVVDSSYSLTYEEVDEWSNALSHLIRSKENDGKFIGVLLPRSCSFIITTIAVLKSGRTMAPISTSHPVHYMTAMLDDLDSPLIITNEHCTNLLPPSYDKAKIIRFENIERKDNSRNRSKSPIPCNSISYCIFTSGTTGVPKGVLVKHSSVMNIIQAYKNLISLTPYDKTLFFHNPAFDASLADFWPSLISGSSIFIPDESLSYDPTALWNFICENKLTYANIPTVLAHAIFSSFHEQTTRNCSLRWIAFGGERLKIPPPIEFPAKCLNAYGPTETTVDATHVVATAESAALGSIGKPVPNGRIYILDDNMAPVPVGVEGVVWIGGVGVAAGYLKRSELTAKVFVVNPFVGDGKEMIYNSGDVGKWLEDGSISLVGRSGEQLQVKINGFRVEIEGVEASISTHPKIQQVVVVPRTGDVTTLVAFCVQVKTAELEPDEINWGEYLKAHLPYYAIPTNFVWLDAIPVTSSGKVDRRALALMRSEEVKEEGVILTETEAELQSIWSDLLKIEKNEIKRSTNFYQIGGNSLMSGALVRAINGDANIIPITFKDIYENPTIGTMGKLIEDYRAQARKSSAELSGRQKYIWYHQVFELGLEDPMYHRYKLIRLGNPDELELSRLGIRVNGVLEKYFESDLSLRIQTSSGTLIANKSQGWNTFAQSQFQGVVKLRRIGVTLTKEFLKPFDILYGKNPLLRSQLLEIDGEIYLGVFWHSILLDKERAKVIMEDLDASIDIESSNLLVPLSEQFNIAAILCDFKAKDVIRHVENVFKNSGRVLVHEGDESVKILHSTSDEDVFSQTAGKRKILLRIENEECNVQREYFSGDFDMSIRYNLKTTKLHLEYNTKYYTEAGIKEIVAMLSNESTTHESAAAISPEFHGTPLETKAMQGTAWWNIISKLWSLTTQIPIHTILRNPNSNFFALGGKSEAWLKSSWAIQSLAKNTVPFLHFLKNPTLATLVDSLLGNEPSPGTLLSNILELELEELSTQLHGIHNRNINKSDGILLTGATGYLGSFILESMIKSNLPSIYCLVRGGSARLLSILQKYGIVKNSLPSSIHAVDGDLTKPNLGLSPSDYENLLRNVSKICHCGADVNLLNSYSQLKGANVYGTLEICKLALRGNMKLFYISTTDSTVGQFLYEVEEQDMFEGPAPPPYFDLGYYQTKWVAERLVTASSSSIDARILRIGTVGAHSKKPIVNPTSFDGNFLRMCRRLGYYPLLKGFTIPYSDVDWSGDTLTGILTGKVEIPFIVNVVQKNYPLLDVLTMGSKSDQVAVDLKGVEAGEWLNHLQRYCENNNDRNGKILLVVFEQTPWAKVCKIKNLFMYLTHMPVIQYPNESVLGGQAGVGESSMAKYLELHCNGLIES